MTSHTESAIRWPQKTRELQSNHFDSTIWNDFAFRKDDIFIATYAKSGTTWLQQIIAQLLFHSVEGLNVAEMSPWLDLRVPPKAVKLPEIESQTHRRFMKTHLPVDALVFSRVTSVPTGYGHNYAPASYLDAWIEVTEPDEWRDGDTARLKRLFAE